jgi:hypothetical protein
VFGVAAPPPPPPVLVIELKVEFTPLLPTALSGLVPPPPAPIVTDNALPGVTEKLLEVK